MRLVRRLSLDSVRAFSYVRMTGILIAVIVTLSACGGGPPPRLFLLDERLLRESDDVDVASPGTAPEASDTEGLSALGISQIELPGYASDARIASRNRRGEVVLANSLRWAEEPQVAITRLLAIRLRERATATVQVQPWPRDYEPQARIEVIFDRLLREPDGGVHMVGQIQLLSGDGRALLRSVPFDMNVVGRSTQAQEFFSTATFGVDAIAQIIVENLLSMVEKQS